MTLRVGASLALGAAVSIAIACIAAGRGTTFVNDDSGSSAASKYGDYRVLIARRIRLSPAATLFVMSREVAVNITDGSIVTMLRSRRQEMPRNDLLLSEIHAPPSWADERSEFRFGWPLDCLWGACDEEARGSDVTYRLGSEHMLCVWPLSAPRFEVQPVCFFREVHTGMVCVPTGVMRMGLVVNMLIFAIPMGVILFGFGPIRRVIRLRRNHCPKCNYNLRGVTPNSPCPECGSTPRVKLPA